MTPDTPANRRRVTIKAMTAAGWITGTMYVPTAARLADYMVRAPSFLSLSGGILKGNIAVKPGLRLSDYLAKRHNFVPVKECKYHVRVPQSRSVAEEFCPFVLLNSEKIIGLSERGDAGGLGE